jgi:hypothetical protein
MAQLEDFAVGDWVWIYLNAEGRMSYDPTLTRVPALILARDGCGSPWIGWKNVRDLPNERQVKDKRYLNKSFQDLGVVSVGYFNGDCACEPMQTEGTLCPQCGEKHL